MSGIDRTQPIYVIVTDLVVTNVVTMVPNVGRSCRCVTTEATRAGLSLPPPGRVDPRFFVGDLRSSIEAGAVSARSGASFPRPPPPGPSARR